MSHEKDIMSLYSETPVIAFTENDIFEGLGIRHTQESEVINLIQPKHL